MPQGHSLACACFLATLLVVSSQVPTEYDVMKALRKFSHAGSMGWLGSNNDPCEWAGVACDITGNLVQIKLNHLGLTGAHLPSEWKIFNKLKVLDLRSNSMEGPLPEEWGSMTSLEHVYLDDNSLEGPIPESWCKLRNLKHLYLDNNSLEGQLPDCETWVNMEVIYIENNRISGSLPKGWASMRKLTTLMAANNRIKGPLPEEWSQLESVEHIHLEDNELNGNLPETWSFLSYLETLYLQGNKLGGPVPKVYGYLINLRILGLDNNQLTGSLPESWWQLSKLEYMYLHGNKFSGELPGSWGAMGSLKEIHLDGNELQGALPEEWETLGSLTHMYLRDNQLSGRIPDQWSALQELEEMYLWGNEISGPLPQSIGSLTKLRVIALHKNKLTGRLPVDWRTLSNLEYLYLQDNLLSGSLPGEWGEMVSLQQMMLQSNQLEDSHLPVGWQKLMNLIVLNLADNTDVTTTIRKDWFDLVSRLKWLGIKNTNSPCVESAVVEDMSDRDAEALLRLLGRKTAPTNSKGHPAMSVCVKLAPPAPLSPPPPPNPPAPPPPPPPYTTPPFPPAPPAPEAPPLPMTPSPSPSPTPAPTPSPETVTSGLEFASLPNQRIAAPEQQTMDTDTGERQREKVEVKAVAANVNEMVTKALIIAAALVLAFVLIVMVLGAVWYYRKTSDKDGEGQPGPYMADRQQTSVVMENSVLSMLPHSEGPTPRVTDSIDSLKTGGRLRSPFFMLTTPREYTPRTPSLPTATPRRTSSNGSSVMLHPISGSPATPAIRSGGSGGILMATGEGLTATASHHKRTRSSESRLVSAPSFQSGAVRAVPDVGHFASSPGPSVCGDGFTSPPGNLDCRAQNLASQQAANLLASLPAVLSLNPLSPAKAVDPSETPPASHRGNNAPDNIA